MSSTAENEGEMKLALLISLLLASTILAADRCAHQWETRRIPRVVALDYDLRPICDSVDVLKSYRRQTPDSLIYYVRCARCGEKQTMYARKSAGASYLDSLRAQIDSILKAEKGR
jgi:hypothetical protein